MVYLLRGFISTKNNWALPMSPPKAQHEYMQSWVTNVSNVVFRQN